MLQSTNIHVTDGLTTLIDLLRYNIHLNIQNVTSPIAIQAQKLSWGDPPNIIVPVNPDVILAADCAYLEESFPLLVRTLEDLMGEQTVLWFCYKKRRKRDRDCIKLIGKSFEVQMVRGQWESEGVWLFVVKKRSHRTK